MSEADILQGWYILRVEFLTSNHKGDKCKKISACELINHQSRFEDVTRLFGVSV